MEAGRETMKAKHNPVKTLFGFILNTVFEGCEKVRGSTFVPMKAKRLSEMKPREKGLLGTSNALKRHGVGGDGLLPR